MLVSHTFGFGANPRKPLQPMSEEAATLVLDHEYLKSLMKEESITPELASEGLEGPSLSIFRYSR